MPSSRLRRAGRAALTSLTLTAAVIAAPSQAAAPVVGAPDQSTTTPATAAIEYIAGTQASDGGFFGPNQHPVGSGGLAETLAASAVDAGLTASARRAALDRLAATAPDATTRPAYTARVVMAIVANGGDPHDFGGVDYGERLASALTPGGWWEGQSYANAVAALGWAALGHELPSAAILWMKATQCADGGWGFQGPCVVGSDVDTSALMLSALVAGGVDMGDLHVRHARDFLVAAQNREGGFGGRIGAATNSNSTGLVLSAIAALGEDPRQGPWNRGNGADPLTQLLRLQTPEGGFLWMENRPTMINNYATVQALPGVAGVAYPVPPRSDATGWAPGDGRPPWARPHD